MIVKRKVVVPAYKAIEDTVVDRYMCEVCNSILKENRRRLMVARKAKSNSYIYYGICKKCE